MLRIIHTADVHLGARHDDLGEQAAAQRERQFAAFKATVDLALTEKADVFLIAGDLFDSNVQPRRSVERVAAELKRLAEARIRTVIIPGTHDCYDRASIYRAYDLVALAGRRPDDGLDHDPRPGPSVGPPDDPRPRGRRPGLRHQAGAAQPAAGDRRTAGGTRGPRQAEDRLADRDDPRLDLDPGQDRARRGRHHDRRDRQERPRLPGPRALALGPDGQGGRRHVRLSRSARAGRARPGPRRQGAPRRARRQCRRPGPSPSASSRSARPASTRPRSMPRRSPASRRSIELLAARADPDLVLDVRLAGVQRDDLDLHPAEIENALAPHFLKIRVRDRVRPGADRGSAAVARHDRRRLHPRPRRRASPSSKRPARPAEAAEQRDALRLGRLLLAGHEVSL